MIWAQAFYGNSIVEWLSPHRCDHVCTTRNCWCHGVIKDAYLQACNRAKMAAETVRIQRIQWSFIDTLSETEVATFQASWQSVRSSDQGSTSAPVIWTFLCLEVVSTNMPIDRTRTRSRHFQRLSLQLFATSRPMPTRRTTRRRRRPRPRPRWKSCKSCRCRRPVVRGMSCSFARRMAKEEKEDLPGLVPIKALRGRSYYTGPVNGKKDLQQQKRLNTAEKEKHLFSGKSTFVCCCFTTVGPGLMLLVFTQMA